MRIRDVLTSCLAATAIGLVGLPTVALAQAPSAADTNNVVNKDGLLVTLDSSDSKALLGGESVIKGTVKNTGSAPLFNAGWTVELPPGVSFVSAESGPGDHGKPKVTTLIFPNNVTKTVVFWNNVADLSPGVEATFEIKVKNDGPKPGSAPSKTKVYTPGETFEAQAWAGASPIATVLPAFQEFGLAGINLDSQAGQAQSSRVWASDKQPVKVEGLLSTIKLTNLIEDVALRGNQPLQRQLAVVELDRTTDGDLTLTGPVTISIDPEWEIMGTCVRNSDCFVPSEDQVRWVDAPKPHWEVDVPADKFDFKDGSHAKAYLELAALDKTNVDPGATGVKVNPAGYGGNGDDATTPDDIARRGASAAAYANNTGETTQNKATTFEGKGTTAYVHPWNGSDATKYPNQPTIAHEVPKLNVRIEDAGVHLQTSMDAGGHYKQDGKVTKTLTVKTDEYTRLPANRTITMTLPAEECFVNPGTAVCVESGQVSFTKVSEGPGGTTPATTVTGTVTKTPEGKFVLTIPAESISEATSTTETFDIKTKVRADIDGAPVVNGKPLETLVDYSWGTGPITVSSKDDIPAAKPNIFTTVAFPTNGNGACPAPLGAIPNPKEIDESDAIKNRTIDELGGAADNWGKYRRVRAGDELCFQINVEFPQGITTREPVLNVYLPSETELKSTVDDITFSGTLAGAKQLDGATAIDSALKHVANPPLRTPLTYTFGNSVAGGSTVTLVYKATVKNAGVVDPSGPPVLFDNLGKLTFKDQKGEFHNSRDAAAYGFVSPLLMVTVDKTPKLADRGQQVPFIYNVENVGGGPARKDALLTVRLPEGQNCASMQVSGGVDLVECVDGVAAGDRTGLIAGDYAILKVRDEIPAAGHDGTPGKVPFTLTFKNPIDRAPGTDAHILVGVLTYQNGNSRGEKTDTRYFPTRNLYCKNQGNPSPQASEQMDKACIEKIASTLLKTPITPGDIGTKAVIAPNTASGGKQATVQTQIYTTWPSAQLTGTSSDLTQNPDPHWTVVPGEKGSITVKLLANKADPTATDPAPTHLVGSLVPGNTWVELTISGVDASDDEATRPFATTEAIRQAVARAFGTHADATKVTVTPIPGEDKYTINIPLESYPLADITVTFPEIFTTTTKAPKAEVVYHYRPVTLLHRDDSNGEPRLNQPPVSNAPHTNIRPNPVQYLRKVPNVEVLKAVKTPGNARIAGGDDINYEVTLTNPSQVTAYGLKITDTLPVDFTHKPALSTVEVSPASLDALKAQLNWTLSDNGRTGVWPADTFNLPAGGRVTITYVATASRVVTADEAYKNVVAVPYKSLPNDTPGVETYTANGDATVRGHDVRAVTTIAPQTPLHANGKVQHGELVTTVTTLTIPNNISVPNLSVLSDLVGANLDPAKAKVTVTCPAGVTCATNPAFVPGSNGERLGVVVADQPIVNTSGQPITITIETTNLLVVDGDGPITVKADAYRGPNTPTSVDTFKPEDKASSGSSGQVEIMVPTLTLDTTLVAGHDGHNPGVPVVTPIEPGTPNLHVRFVVTNTTPGSEARGDVINVKDALEAIGLKVDPSFSSPNFDGTNLKTPAIPGDPTKPFEVFVPVIWDMGKFTGPDRPTGELRTPVVVNGQTGPLNVVPGAKDPETTGKPITANTTLALTPVYRPTPPVIPPVPGPQPQPQPQPQPTPTPTVDPSPAGDRPTEIPPAPKPPATPAPVAPGHTPSTAGPEDRATSWVDATIPAGEKPRSS